jgi:Ca2+/Na+ antiporter
VTRTEGMAAFLNGAVALAYLVAGVYFLRFWRKTRDRLFLSFSAAFVLLATNLVIVVALGVDDQRTGYSYVLRVLGFLLILYAILRKNVGGRRPAR